MHLPQPWPATGIGPGSRLHIDMAGTTYACTAAFIFTDGTKMYLGAAGHCFLPEDKTATHGPGADYDGTQSRVNVCVSSCTFGGLSGFFLIGKYVTLGEVVYARQTKDGVDVGWDFGLVEIPEALHDLIRPSLPVWGGPRFASQGFVFFGTPVCSYGYGVGTGETFATSARAGVGTGGGDARSLVALLPANQGDSGSAIVTCSGEITPGSEGLHGVAPAGILTHGVSGVVTGVPSLVFGTTVKHAIQMAADDADLHVSVVPGS